MRAMYSAACTAVQSIHRRSDEDLHALTDTAVRNGAAVVRLNGMIFIELI